MTSQQENGDQIIDEIMTRVKEYFDLHKTLSIYKLYDFLVFIELAAVFGAEEDLENIWSIFTEKTYEIKEIDYPSCQKGMTQVLYFTWEQARKKIIIMPLKKLTMTHEKVSFRRS